MGDNVITLQSIDRSVLDVLSPSAPLSCSFLTLYY